MFRFFTFSAALILRVTKFMLGRANDLLNVIPTLSMALWLFMIWILKTGFVVGFPFVLAAIVEHYNATAGIAIFWLAILHAFWLAGRKITYWVKYGKLEYSEYSAEINKPYIDHQEIKMQKFRREEEKAALEREAKKIHGDSRFMDIQTMKIEGYASSHGLGKGFILGRAKDYQTDEIFHVDYAGDGHMLTLAQSGAGKGIGLVIPNLMQYKGSVFLIDPKGENTAITARARRERLGQDVFVLNPFSKWTQEPWNLPCNAFNPIDRITLKNPNYMSDAMLIAESLIPEGGKDPHWNDGARNMVEAILLHIGLCVSNEKNKNLLYLRKISSLPKEKLEDFFKQAMKKAPTEAVADILSRFTEMNSKEFNSFRSIISGQLKFLSLPEMQDILLKSDFKLEDLKEKNITISIVLPDTKMKMCGGWMRLMVDLCLEAVKNSEVIVKEPVLFLIDEAYTLGHSKQLADAFGLARGYGLRVWPIFQHLGQIKKNYPNEEWHNFITSSCIQLFGVGDLDTAKYFSETFGEYGTIQTSYNAGTQTGSSSGASEGSTEAGSNQGEQKGRSSGASEGKSYSPVKRILITAAELMDMRSGEMICRIPRRSPLKIARINYWEHDAYNADADRNPFRNEDDA